MAIQSYEPQMAILANNEPFSVTLKCFVIRKRVELPSMFRSVRATAGTLVHSATDRLVTAGVFTKTLASRSQGLRWKTEGLTATPPRNMPVPWEVRLYQASLIPLCIWMYLGVDKKQVSN